MKQSEAAGLPVLDCLMEPVMGWSYALTRRLVMTEARGVVLVSAAYVDQQTGVPHEFC